MQQSLWSCCVHDAHVSGWFRNIVVHLSLQIPHEDIQTLFPHEKVKEHLHDFALNPYQPMIRGTGQRPDIFFQNTVAAHKYYEVSWGYGEEEWFRLYLTVLLPRLPELPCQCYSNRLGNFDNIAQTALKVLPWKSYPSPSGWQPTVCVAWCLIWWFSSWEKILSCMTLNVLTETSVIKQHKPNQTKPLHLEQELIETEERDEDRII